MSIQSEINRISGNVANALTAIANKGVTVPQGSNSDDLATLIAQISGGGTPAISIVDTADSHGGMVRTVTALDISDSTAVAADVLNSKWFYTAQGVKTQGTATGGGGATQHTIHLEFDDSTDTDIAVYYDNALIGTMLTAYAPSGGWTYNNKLVVEAQLDGVTWYQYTPIPIGVQLIDFTAVKNGYVVNSATGEEEVSQWSSVSDFTLIEPTMTFSYIGYEWYNIVFYDATQNYVGALYMHDDADTIENGYAHGTLSPAKIPANASYVRIDSYPTNPSSSELSLIRTA